MDSVLLALGSSEPIVVSVMKAEGVCDPICVGPSAGVDCVRDTFPVGRFRVENRVYFNGMVSVAFIFGDEEERQCGILATTKIGTDDWEFLHSIDGRGAAEADMVATSTGLKIGEKVVLEWVPAMMRIAAICAAMRTLSSLTTREEAPTRSTRKH